MGDHLSDDLDRGGLANMAQVSSEQSSAV